MRLLCAVLLAVLLPAIAAAQNSGIYIQAGPLLDSLFTSSADGFPVDGGLISSNLTFTWNDSNGDRLFQPGEEGPSVSTVLPTLETRTSRERFAPGASVAVGVFITPSVSLRLEGSFQGERVTTIETSPLRLFAPAASRHGVSSTDVFVSAGWHQGESRRVTITYLGGMVFRRQREETTLTFNYSVIQTINGRPTQTVIRQTDEQTFGSTFYGAGVMAGVDVAFNLSQRLAIVPQVLCSEYSLRVQFAPQCRRNYQSSSGCWAVRGVSALNRASVDCLTAHAGRFVALPDGELEACDFFGAACLRW